MKLIITLQREVADESVAQQLTTIVKNKLVDHQEIQIQSQIVSSIPLEAPG